MTGRLTVEVNRPFLLRAAESILNWSSTFPDTDRAGQEEKAIPARLDPVTREFNSASFSDALIIETTVSDV